MKKIFVVFLFVVSIFCNTFAHAQVKDIDLMDINTAYTVYDMYSGKICYDVVFDPHIIELDGKEKLYMTICDSDSGDCGTFEFDNIFIFQKIKADDFIVEEVF